MLLEYGLTRECKCVFAGSKKEAMEHLELTKKTARRMKRKHVFYKINHGERMKIILS